jgi:hypothetical protein
MCVLVACGDDDSGGGGAIDPGDFEQAFADAVCTFYVNCGLLEDRAQCAQIELDGVTSEASVAGVEAGSVTYDSNAASLCLTRLSSCDRGGAFALTSSAAAACASVFRGTVAAGGACTNRVQCASGSCDLACDPQTCCEGTCVGDTPSFVYVKLGETCGTGKVCTDSTCDRATSTCVELKALGSVCNEGFECKSQLCTNDVCVQPAATGDACSSDDDCALFGDICSAATQTCAPVGLTGDACANSDDCSPIYMCGSDQTCAFGPRLGEQCESDCVDASYCDPATTTCVARKPDGATCVDEGECEGTCTAQGVCATYPLCI